MTLSTGIALSPIWLRGEAWRRDDSRVEEMFSLSPYTELARKAEAAALDFLFCPEAGYLRPDSVGGAPGFATLDSFTLVTALTPLTTRIGLVPTIQTAYAHPVPVARALASLQQISGGRAGWNVVTALGGEENYGLDTPPGSEERYARACEFVEVVNALWDSFPAEAFVADRASGIFADPGKVKAIDFEGEHFRVAGPMALPSHPAGRLPVVQAGASPTGIAFAGAVADVVFGAVPDLEDAVAQRAALRDAAVAAGREADDIRFLPGLNMVLADSREEANAVAESSGVDATLHWTVVGTPEDVADAVEARAEARAIDGFIALPGGSRNSVDLFLDQVVQILARRGLRRDGYRGNTLREHLGLRG